jgi:hypothetical protein
MSQMPRFVSLAVLALGCGGGDLVLPEEGGQATAITMVAGDEQTAVVGGPLDDPLVVKVTDEAGLPVAGVTIQWTASAGSVDPASTTTGTDGRAATRRILGDALGAQTATAARPGLDGSPVRFEHTAVPGDATRLVKVGGDGQSGRVGTRLAASLVVRLLDASDNPIAGHAVTWLVTGGGGTISPSNGTTDAGGRSSARWTLGPTAGRQTATAVVSGVGVVQFTATATSPSGGGGDDDDDDDGGGGGGDDDDDDGGKGGGKGGGKDDDDDGAAISPSRVAIWRGNNQTTRAGSAVSAPPAVIVTDAAGRAVSGVSVSFSVIGGGGRVTGAVSTTNAEGVAAVDSWILGSNGGTNRLQAALQGSGIAGNPITFTATATATVAPRGPDRLVFRVQPSRTEEGEKIEPVVQVAVVNDVGLVTGREGEVRLELRGGDGGARLRGSSRKELSDGVATFQNLRIDREGRGYRLRASVSGLTPVESIAFDIVDD